ncbi:MAG: undecaprenyl-diphosphatase [Planctomycetota bacterium]|nr:MAG: undecaprenyl-diphosphatase [Planctomycetota bacterium]
MNVAIILAVISGHLLLLGAIQGATEFLPVSSSGHLVLFREWLGLESSGDLSREIALHFGTVVAVVVFCFKDLLAMLRGGSAGLWKLAIGASLVTGVLGLSFEETIEQELNSLGSVGIGLLITSLLLIVIAPKNDERQTREVADGTWTHGLLLGAFQSMALMPGVSRAGSTIVGALVLGYLRRDAVRVAFLISIPAVGGAVLKKATEGDNLNQALAPDMLAAMGVACAVGLLALRFISVNVGPRSLRLFGAYTALMGLAALLTA